VRRKLQDIGWSGRHPNRASVGFVLMSASSPSPNSPLSTTKSPEAWLPLVRVAKAAGRPLERFLQIEAASGILLFIAAALALAWANSPWLHSYVALWHTPVGIRLGSFEFERSLAWVVNDGLMVIFFFQVGMEIRREVYKGELSEWRRAALPATAALGGMVAPALIYLALAGHPSTRSGWGVPMATDIAFALGVLTLLGKRVPAALRVLLLALAVIDDLGAIVVIALFYSAGLAWEGLGVAAFGFAAILVMQRLGVRPKLAYVAPAVVAWAGVYVAGIHPTIAGVMVGLMTPVRAWLGRLGFVEEAQRQLDGLRQRGEVPPSAHGISHSLHVLDVARREALSPAESLIEQLHPWVAFGIMPVFALANAGVTLSSAAPGEFGLSVSAGAALGLLVGKPIGVLLICWAALKLRIASLPLGLGRRHLLVLGVIAGIGFTMSLFIAQLAFDDPQLLAAAKLGVLAASGAAAILGLVLGRLLLPLEPVPGAALTADEAEQSADR
jgi:NhaA family Na+:H+ antiporter